MDRDATVLQIDLGNSALKWRLVQGGRVLDRGTRAAGMACLDVPAIDRLPSAVLVASVATADEECQLAGRIRQQWSLEPWFARSEAETLGLRNSYVRPETMGVDRWLAMLAAWHGLRERVCVVDAGSALTIDIVAASGQHEGGYILPGATLMQQSLLRDTRRVRFDEAIVASLEPGASTAEAVCHGAMLAQCGAVRLALNRAVADGSARPRLVVAGGDGKRLVEQLDEVAEFRHDLVFEGLALAAIARSGNIV